MYFPKLVFAKFLFIYFFSLVQFNICYFLQFTDGRFTQTVSIFEESEQSLIQDHSIGNQNNNIELLIIYPSNSKFTEVKVS